MKEYLENRFYLDNHPKYHKYFNLWYSNLTRNQLYYFNIDKTKKL